MGQTDANPVYIVDSNVSSTSYTVPASLLIEGREYKIALCANASDGRTSWATNYVYFNISSSSPTPTPTPTSTPVPTPTPIPVPTPTPTPTPTGNPIPEPDPNWSTTKKTQYYLDKMGFETGGVDGIFGVKSSVSLILLQYYLGNVTGAIDTTSYDAVKNAANLGITFNTVNTYINNNWNAGTPNIQKDISVNGYLSENNMVRISTQSYSNAYLEKKAALSWAVMVKIAMQNSSINVSNFAAMGSSSGFRPFHEQIEAYISFRHGGFEASCPYFAKGRTYEEAINNRSTRYNANNSYAESWIQNNWNNFTDDDIWNDVPDSTTATGGDLFGYGGSNHGWGLALDMPLGYSGSTEHNWLSNNASTYKYYPYAPEYWHWNYYYN